MRRRAIDPDDACLGREGNGNCPYPPKYVVAGDLACVYHLINVVELRLREVKSDSVKVERIKR